MGATVRLCARRDMGRGADVGRAVVDGTRLGATTMRSVAPFPGLRTPESETAAG